MNDLYLPGSLHLPWILLSLMVGLVAEPLEFLEAVWGQVGVSLEMTTARDIPLPHPFREKTVLQSTNRKLERRVKELSIQIDDERQHVNDQKDQVRMAARARQPYGKYILRICLKAKRGPIS